MKVTLRDIKKHAKKLSKLLPLHAEVKLSLMACQEIVAAMHGFSDWHAAVKKTTQILAEPTWVRTTNIAQTLEKPSCIFDLAPRYSPDFYDRLLTPGWVAGSGKLRAVGYDFDCQTIAPYRLCREAHIYTTFKETGLSMFLRDAIPLINHDMEHHESVAKTVRTYISNSLPVELSKFKQSSKRAFYSLRFHGVSLHFPVQLFESCVRELEKLLSDDLQEYPNGFFEKMDHPVFNEKIRYVMMEKLLPQADAHFRISKSYLPEFVAQSRRLMANPIAKDTGARTVVALIQKGVPVEIVRFAAVESHPEFYVLDFCGVELNYSADVFKAAIDDLAAVQLEIPKLRPVDRTEAFEKIQKFMGEY